MGCCRRHALVVAEERHAKHLTERHVLQHLHRLVDRRHAVGDMRIEEGGVIGSDDDVALGEHVERSAARHAVDRTDHRFPEVARFRPEIVTRIVVHEVVRRAVQTRVTRHVGELGLVSIDADTERRVAGGGEHDCVDPIVAAERPPRGLQLLLHGGAEGVVGLGSIERDDGDLGGLVDLDRDRGERSRVESVWFSHDIVQSFSRRIASAQSSVEPANEKRTNRSPRIGSKSTPGVEARPSSSSQVAHSAWLSVVRPDSIR